MTKIPRYSSLPFILLCLCNIHLSNTLNGGFSVEIIHRDSSRSPFYRPTETHYQRVANALNRSINRANHFNQSSISPNTAESIVTPDIGEYIMSYSVGTPPIQFFGIVDTGSNFIWLQCQPCNTCYKQTTPIFDPSKSNTYKTIPCNSSTCHESVSNISCSARQTCEYTSSYGDGSLSQGDLSVETLTLENTNGLPLQFPKTVIGCGHNNNLYYEGKNSGIIGLGRGPVSLINQMGSSMGGKFSYCFVPFLSNFTSKLYFGNAAVISGVGAVSTPMVSLEENYYYSLSLESLSVGNKTIKVGSSSSKSNERGNIIIDSGTLITYLPDDVYANLKSAVADVVKLQRVGDLESSLCYKSTYDQLDVPAITVHFKGADVTLNAINTFVPLMDDVVCFSFGPGGSIGTGSIFGSLAQQNFLVGYDLQKKTVSFKPADCTKQ